MFLKYYHCCSDEKLLQQLNIVLETLDTKETTYVWHLSKKTSLFKKELELINQKLNWIRNNGRQSFLEVKNEKLSKIVHDYNEGKKGFFKWKKYFRRTIILNNYTVLFAINI